MFKSVKCKIAGHRWDEWKLDLQKCLQERSCQNCFLIESRNIDHEYSEWQLTPDKIYERHVCHHCSMEEIRETAALKASYDYYSRKINSNEYLNIKIGNPDAIRTALIDGQKGSRASICALGVFGDSSVVDPLIHLMREGGAHSRQDAAAVLECIGDSKAIDVIFDGLQHEYIGDREQAVVYKGVTCNVDMNQYIRSSMVIALGRFGDKKALEILKKALHDSEKSVRNYAQWAINYIESTYPKISVLAEIDYPVKEDISKLIQTLMDIMEYEYLNSNTINIVSDFPDNLKFYQHSSLILRRRFAFRSIRALKILGSIAIDPLLQISSSIKERKFGTNNYFDIAINEIQTAKPN